MTEKTEPSPAVALVADLIGRLSMAEVTQALRLARDEHHSRDPWDFEAACQDIDMDRKD